MTKNHAYALLPVALQLLVASCFDVGDLDHVEGESADSGASDAADDARSADAAPTQSDTDAGADADPDTGAGPETGAGADAGTEIPRAPCGAPTQQCHPDELCAPDGFCVERCSAGGACVVATSARTMQALIADEGAVFYSTAPTRDALGNLRQDAELHRVDASGSSALLVSGSKELERLQHLGDYVYWHAGGNVWRVRKDGSTAVEELYQTPCREFLPFVGGQLALQLAEGLFVGSLDGTAALHKISNAYPEIQPLTSDEVRCLPLAGAGSEAFRLHRIENGSQLIGTDLVTMSERTIAADPGDAGDPFMFAVAPPYAYQGHSDSGGPMVTRLEIGAPLADLQTVAQVERPSRFVWWGATPQLHGAWVYYLRTVKEFDTHLVTTDVVRTSLVELGSAQVLVPSGLRIAHAFFVNPDNFAVTDRALFAFTIANEASYEGSLLYRLPLPEGG